MSNFTKICLLTSFILLTGAMANAEEKAPQDQNPDKKLEQDYSKNTSVKGIRPERYKID